MQIYSFLGFLIGLLILSYNSGLSSQPDFPSVKVEFNGSALLPCSERCSGVVRWTVSYNRSDVLAECDRTSCRSVKEGYQMIHEDYLKGNLSLSISGADFRKRNWYTCDCDGQDFCDVSLRLKPPEIVQQMKPGDSLTLDFPVPEPIKVTFKRNGETNPVPLRILEVEGRKFQSDPEYEKRVEFGLHLSPLQNSDSGVYTLEDTKNEEVVSTYRITVKDEEKRSWLWNAWMKDEFGLGLGAGLFLGAVLGYFCPAQIARCWRWMKIRVQRLCGDADADADAAEDKTQPSAEHEFLKESCWHDMAQKKHLNPSQTN